MNVLVNDSCIGCGACESICDAVFSVEDRAVVKEAGIAGNEDCVKEAADACPVCVPGFGSRRDKYLDPAVCSGSEPLRIFPGGDGAEAYEHQPVCPAEEARSPCGCSGGYDACLCGSGIPALRKIRFRASGLPGRLWNCFAEGL